MSLQLRTGLIIAAVAIGAADSADAQGIIRTIAGGRAPEGDAMRQVLCPGSVASDGAGNCYIGDYNTASVYKVSPGGQLTRVAGSGVAGYSGDGGPATQARLQAALGVAADSAGNARSGAPHRDAFRPRCG